MKLKDRLQSIIHTISHRNQSPEQFNERADTPASNVQDTDTQHQNTQLPLHRSVEQLTRDELDELRTALYHELPSELAAAYFDASYIPDSVLVKHYAGTTFVPDDFTCNIQPEPVPDEGFTQTRIPAKSLPDGWEWVKYDDGSGHLEGPQGQRLFSYDLVPYSNANGVEFKETAASGWSVYWNNENQGRTFWKYAEEKVLLQHLPQQELPSEEPAPAYEPEM